MSRLKPEMHPLLNLTTINLLFDKNIHTVPNFLDAEIKQIAIITSLSYKDILVIRKHLINKNSALVRNGLDYYHELIQKSAIISTGIENLDLMLQGGLMTGNVYEICGLPVSGKTQFCLTLAKNVAQNLEQSVYYIDTKRDFSGRKVLSMFDQNNISETKIAETMSKMLVKQINTKYDLINCLYGIQSEIQNGLQLRLIIIDSLPPLFYQSSDCARNYGIMNNFVNIMYLLAREYHTVFVVTNVVTTWYEGDFGNKINTTEKLGLGKYWFNVSNSRLIIKPTNTTSQYEFTVVKSNKLVEGKTCLVRIGDLGMF